MTVQHISREIPLHKLVLWDGNVRKTAAATAIDELAASIAAHGLLNPLTIASAPKGRFVVIAGGRRLAALKMLAKAGTIPKTEMIACRYADDDIDAVELSLAENVVRVAMHPADQFEAWRTLADQGHELIQIARRFGVAESTVRKRLALARVSPVLFEAYRQGSMDIEVLQAFTVTDDHARQEAVWTGLNDWQRDDARAIRRALTESDVPTGDRRVRFIGLDVYEAAGGSVKRDLFAADGGGYCEDAALLDRLVMEKLEAHAQAVKGEGWSWTEARMCFPWDERQLFDETDPDGGDEDEPHWSDEAKALTGCMIYLGHDGAVIDRGLIKIEAAADDEEEGGDDQQQPEEAADDAKVPALPASLIEDLTAHRTAALRIELARRPDVALAVTVHAMALSAFYRTGERGLKGGLTIRGLKGMQGHDDDAAVIAHQQEADRLKDRLPGNPADLWEWCLYASQDDLLDVLAVAVAYGVDAVVTKNDQNRNGVAFGNALADALNLDMAAWYKPTAEGYFSRIPKALILSDLEAARGAPGAPAWGKMKKSELAAVAERECASLSWIPDPLR